MGNVLADRVRTLRSGQHRGQTVVYVMGRDFRVQDNWALLYAQEIALQHKAPLAVLVHFGKNFIKTNKRQHTFFIDSLRELSVELEQLNIPFHLTFGDWKTEVKQFVDIHEVGTIVTDFSPLHEMRWWWNEVAGGLNIPIYEVDAHNIVPCWVTEDSEAYAPQYIRPQLKKLYKKFGGTIPAVSSHPHAWGESHVACWPRAFDGTGCAIIDWEGVRLFGNFESRVEPVEWCRPGAIAAENALNYFLKKDLKEYVSVSEDPIVDIESKLTPYIRYGLLSRQRIVHELTRSRANNLSRERAVEEFYIKRELAENFCFYQDDYDTIAGLREWARESLREHSKDKRLYVYTQKQFEAAETHDLLWNAAQSELKNLGKMHRSIRAYWAKKILEWSKSPEEAISIALTLYDRYSLDGRDPMTYASLLSAIGGVHDRGFKRRPIFGKVRYMDIRHCQKTFDVDNYVATHNPVSEPAHETQGSTVRRKSLETLSV